VEKINDNTKILLSLRLDSFTGLRDGYAIRGKIIFLYDKTSVSSIKTFTPDSLILNIVVEPGVPTRFISGKFRLRNRGKLFHGPVTSTSLTFLGGQGALPSLGGTFLLKANQGESYEVYIPPTEIARN